MKYPKYMIRPSDGEVFKEVGGGMYCVRASIERWPSNYHHKYPHFSLVHLDFIPAETDEELHEKTSRCFHTNRKFHSRHGDFHDIYKCLDCKELFSVRL